MNQRLYYSSAIFIIVFIAMIAYYPALSNGFILSWDDGAYVIRNPHIQTFSLENIKWIFTAFYAANWHPLTWFSHAVDYAIYGENAWGHHLTSIVFHALNSVWVFLFTIVLLYTVERTSNEPFKFAAIFNLKRFVVSLLTAILFTIHPQHVESVAWIAERKDVLFFFFFMPSLISYLIYKQVSQRNWYITSLILFALSLLSKPMAITLPIILILFDMYPLKQIDLKKPHYKLWLANKIPFLMIAMMAGIFTLLAQSEVGAVASINEVTLQIRLLNAFNSIVAYIEKWLLPLHLSPFYPLQFAQNGWISITVVFITTFLSIYFWIKSQKGWLIGWLFYIITLLPVLGLIQVGSQGMADRYAYLPTLPLYLLLSIGIVSVYQKYSKFISILFVFMVSVSLIHLTHEQLKIWRNELTFWDYVVRFDPDSGLAQGMFGSILMKLGDYERAVSHLEFAVGLSGQYSVSYYDLGNGYLAVGRIDDALKSFETALEKNNAPIETKADIYFNVALIHFSRKEKILAQTALEQTLRLVPNHVEGLRLKKDLQKL
ncbi:MAG: hypothetical protein RIT27_2194 [Pseudomonadota bacterium]|jgi:tetratricopeptide (TPR) repeat protein